MPIEQSLRERISEALAAANVDAEKGIVRDVVLLGLQSSNGYSYDESAVRAAVTSGLYEGVQVYADHVDEGSDGPRPFRELIGAARNARFADGKVRGDIHVIASTGGGRAFLEIAGKPALAGVVGMSHDAVGELSESGPRRVTSLRRVLSVDVVTRPATTKGLFEAQRGGEYDAKLREMAGQKVSVLTAGDATRRGLIVRGPMYEVEIDGEGSYPRLIPAELIQFEATEAKESAMANDKDTADLAALREQLAAQDVELKKLRDLTAIRDTADRVAQATAKLPAKVAARVAEKFKGKAADQAEVDGYVADVGALLEAARAEQNRGDADDDGVSVGPTAKRVTESGGESDEDLLRDAFGAFGMTTRLAKVEG